MSIQSASQYLDFPDTKESAMERLGVFIGTWQGSGRGEYPTIKPFEYEEQLSFEASPYSPLLHYEQRTKMCDPLRVAHGHWESGFVKPLENGEIQISNSQNSGRVEVLQGPLLVDGSVSRLEVAHTLLDNDTRMVQTRRVFEVKGDTLTYRVDMATRTTATPKLQLHLTATLHR